MKNETKTKNATLVLYGIGEALNIITIIIVFVLAVIFAGNIANGGSWYNPSNPQSAFFGDREEYLNFCEIALAVSLIVLAIQIFLCILVHKVYKTMEQNVSGPHILILVLSIIGGGSVFYIVASILGIVNKNKNPESAN